MLYISGHAASLEKLDFVDSEIQLCCYKMLCSVINLTRSLKCGPKRQIQNHIPDRKKKYAYAGLGYSPLRQCINCFIIIGKILYSASISIIHKND